jgi:hypothetical protein
MTSCFMSVNDFVQATQALEPGGSLKYHEGFLPVDRCDRVISEISNRAFALGTPKGVPLYRDENGARRNMPLGEGFGQLYQKRITDCYYYYFLRRNKD